jgi:propionyl-CoA carboxylase alpha chain
MIKASAGGGGKGMRVVSNEKEVMEVFDLIKSEAKASFGDDRLLMERFVVQPRHIEIQIVGDQLGNLVYLPERECSIQRRNQKVIEEAPSVHIDAATRKAMGEQAVSLAKRVGYYSAGTVEFLVDPQRNFYFLEMNTRLQVEHPITELITGYDLVEQMIRVAAGLPLSFNQSDVKIKGHSIESRVYAEDPDKYLPSIGTLSKYQEPSIQSVLPPSLVSSNLAKSKVRCDSGIQEGSEISIYYDPMICKLSTWGPDRDTALEAMRRSLDGYVIRGVTHNIPLLREVMSHPRFISAKKISTQFLSEEFPNGIPFPNLEMPENRDILEQILYIASLVHAKRQIRNKNFLNYSLAAKEFQNGCGKLELTLRIQPSSKKLRSTIPPVEKQVVIRTNSENAVEVSLDSGSFKHVKFNWGLESTLILADIPASHPIEGNGHESIIAQYSGSIPLGFSLQLHGRSFDIAVLSEKQVELSKVLPANDQEDKAMENHLIAPMPGAIVKVSVKPGDVVAEGAALVVLEAMKMQNVLRAPRAGKILKVHAKQGQNVASDDVILEFEPEKGSK